MTTSLKSLLDATIKAGSTNAFPSATSVSIEGAMSTWDNSFTAPKDGFFVGWVDDGGHIQVHANCRASSHNFATNSISVTLPMRKGETCSWYYQSYTGTTTSSFKFVYPKGGT